MQASKQKQNDAVSSMLSWWSSMMLWRSSSSVGCILVTPTLELLCACQGCGLSPLGRQGLPPSAYKTTYSPPFQNLIQNGVVRTAQFVTSPCRRFFDLRVWRVVLLDQRGCGASTPRGCLVCVGDFNHDTFKA